MPVVDLKRFMEITVACIHDTEGWKKLAAEWHELLAQSVAACVFLSWPWLDSWMEVYGDGGEWLVLTARDEAGVLIGVAPMMLDTWAGVLGNWIRRVILVGQKADTSSEYLDWILRHGHEEEAVAAFCRYLFCEKGKTWDLLCFESMRADSPTIPLLQREFARRGENLDVKHSSNAYYMPLPDTWQHFLDSRRGKFRQRWNKFNREHAVAIKIAGRDMTVAEGMAKLRKLNELRWGGRRQSFLSGRYVDFHDRVAARFHELGYLLLIFLEVDGSIVAGRYDFVYGGKGWSFQGGWMPEWEKYSSGKRMLTEIMRWCIDHNIKEYDFLGGEADYKISWSKSTRELVSLEACNPSSVLGRLLQIARSLRARFRRLFGPPCTSRSGSPLINEMDL